MELFFTQTSNHSFEGNKNPAVFLHGLWGGGNNLRHYDFSDLLLSPLYFLDELGFGKSPKPRIDYTPKAHCKALVSTLSTNRKSTFIGNSFGAVLAAYMAHYYPSLVKRLILISPLLYRDSEEAKIYLSKKFVARFTLYFPLIMHASCLLLCKTTLLSYAMPFFSDKKRKEYIRDCVLHRWDTYYSSFTECLVKRSIFPILTTLPTSIKILILYGENDPYINPTIILSIKRSYINIVKVDNGKHDILFDQFQTCLSLIKKWFMESG